MTKCYDRNGKLITDEELFSKLFNNPDYQRLVQTNLTDANGEKVLVSTVWLGLDHSFGQSDAPVIFETFIFGGKKDGYCQRYCNEIEAIKGHHAIILEV